MVGGMIDDYVMELGFQFLLCFALDYKFNDGGAWMHEMEF